MSSFSADGAARRARAAAAIGIAAASVLFCTAASAQDEWKEEGGEKPPPDDRPTKKKDDKPADGTEAKPARILLDLKLGPAFLLSSKGVTEFGFQINAGYALSHDLITKGDAFFLTLSPYMLVGEDLSMIAPLGVQYDLPLSMIPYKGISAYARVSAGYLYQKNATLDFDKGYHGFAVQPALGAKFGIFDRFHVGIEPFAFDILHTFPPKSTAVPEQTISAFQLYIFGGASF